MKKKYALFITIYAAVLLFWSGHGKVCFSAGHADGREGNAPLYEAGSHVRKHFLLKYYRVVLSTCQPETIVDRYFKARGGDAQDEPFIDALADFLLDPKNRIPVQLSVESLRGKVSYGLQKDAVRGMLTRAGFSVDESWNLKEKREHQEDVKLYVKTILGLSKKEHETIHKKKGKGDSYTLALTSHDEAWVEYIPCQERSKESCQRVYFSSSELLRGIIATYISRKACKSSLKDELPQALLERILLASRDRTRSFATYHITKED